MDTGPAIFVAVMFGVLAVIGGVVLVDVIRDRPKPRPAERVWNVWNPAGRHATTGDVWPEHDEAADEDGCWCRGCSEAEVKRMQDEEIGELFAGLVDTPELRDLADRAERGLR